nr:MAG TPA: hypothetical protein [Caudoviricetes sp.]
MHLNSLFRQNEHKCLQFVLQFVRHCLQGVYNYSSVIYNELYFL